LGENRSVAAQTSSGFPRISNGLEHSSHAGGFDLFSIFRRDPALPSEFVPEYCLKYQCKPFDTLPIAIGDPGQASGSYRFFYFTQTALPNRGIS
jgi:hypothetical protein